MKTVCKPKLIIDRLSNPDYPYNVQLWYSHDGAETFVYSGHGKFFKDRDAANAYIEEHRTPTPVFPVVTTERRNDFERQVKRSGSTNCIPAICGCYGRACRQLEKPEGANRMNCQSCPLAKYCSDEDLREYARS